MTTQNVGGAESDKDSLESERNLQNLPPPRKNALRKRKAKYEALKKLQQKSDNSESSSFDSNEEDKQPLIESEHGYDSQKSTKRFKITEEKEMSLESQKSNKENIINSADIKERIDRLQMSNPSLRKNFSKLERNMQKLSSPSENKETRTQKQEIPAVIQHPQCTDQIMGEDDFSRLPTNESLRNAVQDQSKRDENLQKSLLQYILLDLMANQTPQNINLTDVSPQIEMMLKSHILKNLWINAFKRFLYVSKDALRDNLCNLLTNPGTPRSGIPTLPASQLEKRKKSDLLSNGTKESDKNRKNSASFPIKSANDCLMSGGIYSSPKKDVNNDDQRSSYSQNHEVSGSWNPKEEEKH
eukprot:CAMPEP_0196994708 /NCGR_PEP_ID=MMETSP1380-20130617/968_1 /TAXON_ID=5936 /ORGANISM="Euplotes crassus, Strain CT5" /LENGTH=355 /DNA_ID=CAMNT_0042410155 /DNA_START=535 /DNA_END=1603 /DNA_ORIENTATION=+